MITSITGRLVASTPLLAVLQVQGIGYEVHVPLTTAERLPVPGTEVTLHTHAVYREDAQTLYGFATLADRDFFRLLVTHVTGVGPKVALSIMSRLSLPVLEGAIRSGDVPLLAKCPGIGRKTAERLVVELRTKVGGGSDAVSVPAGAAERGDGSVTRDATAALIALGYKAAEADQAVRRAIRDLGGEPTTEAIIKRALS
jgi:Holliday junction DNA helicase RuvA